MASSVAHIVPTLATSAKKRDKSLGFIVKFNIIQQKAGLQSCCSASRGSGIAFCTKQQH